MDALKNLPTPLKIAIPALLVLLIVVGVMLSSGGGGMTTIQTSTDPDQVAAWQWRLEGDKIPSQVVQKNRGTWELRVDAAKEAEARASIGGTNLTTRLKMKTSNKCLAPGSFSTRAQQEQYDNCKAAATIHDQVKSTSGILEARISVVTEDSGELVGSDKMSRVTVQLFLDPDATTSVDSGTLAESIANMVPGGSIEHVVITDSSGAKLWNGSSASAAGANGASSGSCATSSESVDITTKQTQVASCIESMVREDIAPIVGSIDHLQVSVGVRLNPSASTRTTRDIARGAVVSKSGTQSGGGGSKNNSSAAEFEPGVSETSTQTIAGAISRVSLSVTLDSKYSTPARERAVRQILRNYVDPKRDPQPSVTSVEFASPGAAAPKADATGSATGGANGAPAAKAPQTPPVASTRDTHLPTWLIVVSALLLTTMLGAIALLWRRSTRERTQRQVMEQEIRQGEHLFQSFAQENPNDVAEEIMSLLGPAPRGQVPANN